MRLLWRVFLALSLIASAALTLTLPAYASLGDVYTIAGGGSGDGGAAVGASMWPRSSTRGPDGDLFFVDGASDQIRRIDASTGIISLVAGVGVTGNSSDGQPATKARIEPDNLAVASDGRVFFTEISDPRIRVVGTDGVIRTFAGTEVSGFADGPALSARFGRRVGLAHDAATDTLFVADRENHRVRFVRGGVVGTLAGTGQPGYSGDGPAAAARLNAPTEVELGPNGTLYINDAGNVRIRTIIDGRIELFAGNGLRCFTNTFNVWFSACNYQGDAKQNPLADPRHLTVAETGDVYFGDFLFSIVKVDAAGQISRVAGTGTSGLRPDDGSSAKASTIYLNGLALDHHGHVVYSDELTIRHIDDAGILTTIAGTTHAFWGDGRKARSARLQSPSDVAFDARGNSYIADTLNNRIRRIDESETISTLAGGGVVPGDDPLGDGRPATEASLNGPQGVAADDEGNVFIADTGNNRIRWVDTAGIIRTIAGTDAPLRAASCYLITGNPTPPFDKVCSPAPDPTTAVLSAPKRVIVTPSEEDALWIYFTNQEFVYRFKFRPETGERGTLQGVAGGSFFGDINGLDLDAASGGIFFSTEKGTYLHLAGRTTERIADAGDDVAVAPDGSVFRSRGNQIFRLDGSVLAGGGSSYPGDAESAVGIRMYGPLGLAIGPDRNLYVSEFGGDLPERNGVLDQIFYTHRVREIQLVNAPPVAVPDILTSSEDGSATVDVLANDSDDDGDQLSISSLGSSAHGTATLLGAGVIRYVPNANYFGSDSFTYSVSDGKGGSAVGSVAVTVVGIPDAPTANPDTITALSGVATVVDVLANDQDVDGDQLQIISVVTPEKIIATINSDGTLTIRGTKPGTYSVTYTISDPAGLTSSAVVLVTVLGN